MPSHLTRRVFRHLLSSRPLSHGQLASLPSAHHRGKNVRSRIESASQRRSFWSFSEPPARQLKTRSFEPGMDVMLQLGGKKAINVQTPDASAVAKALTDFIKFKNQTETRILETWTRHVLVAYEHLQETNPEKKSGLPRGTLVAALKILSRCEAQEDGTVSVKLSSLIFEDLRALPRLPGDPADAQDRAMALMFYIRILSLQGEASKAKSLLSDLWLDCVETQDPSSFWIPILGGFALEGNDGEIQSTMQTMEALDIPLDRHLYQMLILQLVRVGDLLRTQHWYDQAVQAGKSPDSETLRSLLQFCIERQEHEWGQTLVLTLLERDPLAKHDWDVIFQFSAARGKGVDEIIRMINVMINRSKEAGEGLQPDIDTINGLVRVANSRHDPYAAERYISLGEGWGLQPDATTTLLRIDCRLQAGDIDGAQHAYRTLRGLDVQDNDDIPVLNRLIRALCSSVEPDQESIMSNVEDLTKRKATFEPATIAALCLLHLTNNELFDVIDLLQTHSFRYSIEQRAMIRDVFVAFILDRHISTARAWDAYAILHRTITETPREIRSKLMSEFFGRRNAEMGVHVFGHMRQDESYTHRPTADTYVGCFLGLAMPRATLSQLEIVHNMLKLDSAVEPNTRMWNALMLAYTAREDTSRALEFWEQILHSSEGPSYNSIVIALQACERTPFGDAKAKSIIERLKKFGVEITKQIYEAYVGAMAGNGLAREAEKLVEDMKQETGHEVDFQTLGTLYNASRGDFRKSEAQAWAQKRYPEHWKELEKLGMRRSRREMIYRIDQQVSA